MNSNQESLDHPAKRWVGVGLGCWGLLTLTGCATPRPSAKDTRAFWSGRMALQWQSTPPQNWSASFELQGSAAQGHLVFLSPLGTTLARLSWTPQSAMLVQGQDLVESTDLQSLIQRLTGTDLPITALFAWLAGQATEVPGWQVDLSDHSQGRLTARRNTPAPPALLRIVLER